MGGSISCRDRLRSRAGLCVTASGAPSTSTRAVIEHDEAIHQPHHRVHGVLDDHDGHAFAREPADDGDDLAGLVLAQARRASRRAAGCAACRQARAQAPSAEAACVVSSPGMRSAISARPTRAIAASAQLARLLVVARMHVGADDDVVGDRHARKRPHDLECAPDAGLAQLMRLAADHVLAVEQDRAGIRLAGSR